ncbi:pilin [Neisseria sp.]|uniref:pilin n=1 Tax=Neisseria sp. TaxID=192066 RepID=UPI0026DD588B|nr:pilin [Neisseria sp.]MDO4227473.1 pilin [Neisseria sp.]
MNYYKKTTQSGFTLIELMTVVAIVGILAALALPMYTNYTGKAQVAEGMSLLKGLKTPLVESVSTGSIEQCVNTAAWFTGEVTEGKYVEGIGVSSDSANKRCLLTATFKSAGVNDNIQNKKITVRYSMNTGIWECGTDLHADLVPAVCNNPLLTLE